jgi:competence protein ComEA
MDDQPTARSVRRVTESLGDRLGVSPVSIMFGAAAVVAAMAGAWWALSAPDPPAPEDVIPRASDVAALATSTTVTAPVSPVVLVVHVDGAVVVPGVHEVPVGSRVVDAVDAAGGLTDDADRSRLNLARPLADGERIWVPVVGEEPPVVVNPLGDTSRGPGGDGTPGPIDLNTSDAGALEALPGIGPTIAGAIVDHRERTGPFRRIDDLLEVPGIGPARLAQLESLVSV